MKEVRVILSSDAREVFEYLNEEAPTSKKQWATSP